MTLQSIIDDKNYEIDRKDLLVEKMKRDFRSEKEKDSMEIRRLISQLNSQTTAVASSSFSHNPSMLNKSSAHFKNSEFWDDVGTALEEKDRHIE